MMNRSRLLFAAVGAAACLIAAAGAELGFQAGRAPDHLRHTPVLLFRSVPAVDSGVPVDTAPAAGPRFPAPSVARVPISNREVERRLEAAGAGKGDLSISLAWQNLEDLDLWVEDPAGNRIYYKQPLAPSGGRLDVDRNAGPNFIGGAHLTNRPVENIFWPSGRAAPGTYRVYVHHFATRGRREPTAYVVVVRLGRGRQPRRLTGQVAPGEPEQLVYEFALDRDGRFAPVASVQPAPPAGLPDAPGAPAGDSSTRRDTPVAPERAVPAAEKLRPRTLLALMWVAFWAALLGLLPLALGSVRNRCLGIVPSVSFGPGGVLLRALAAGAASGIAGQVCYQELCRAGFPGPQDMLHVPGFMVAAASLGWTSAVLLPGLGRWAATCAGAAGGVPAALLVGMSAGGAGATPGRLAAAAVIGAAIGVLLALPQEAPATPPDAAESSDLPEPVTTAVLEPLTITPLRSGPVGRITTIDPPPYRQP